MQFDSIVCAGHFNNFLARSSAMTNRNKFMTRAIELAKQAEISGEVPVGAVIVDPSQNLIIGESGNQTISNHDPTAHAEIVAIRRATQKKQNYRLPQTDMYVTLEPCAMCAGAISQARIARLYFAAPDPKGGAVISGVQFFEQSICHSRPKIYQMTEFNEVVAEQLKGFFKRLRK